MNKKQIFDLIVNKCAYVCGVSAEAIKGKSRIADVVDARCLAFHFATSRQIGFTPRDIATLLCKDDPKAIRILLNSYDDRYKRSFGFREYVLDIKSEIDKEIKGK